MKISDSESDDGSPLCCCEYYDRDKQRFHILGCCCNCVAFDEACERFISCRRMPDNLTEEMLLTFQDRLRIPCRGGAKQVSLDTIIPIIVIPLVLGLSALNIYCLIILTITALFCVGYFFIYTRRVNYRTRFFFVWILASVIYMLILFEFTVPLLEILPEENAVLFLFVVLTFFCIYKVKRKCRENCLLQSENGKGDPDNDGESSAVLIEKGEDSDESDYVGNRQSNNCIVCQATTLRFDHHSFILDCCISKANHKYYFFGLIFAILALLLAANLTLTSVCHPFLLFHIFGVHILLPDDCSEVFDQYEMGLSFILSVYSLIIAILATAELVIQIYSISKGVTLNEWKRNRRVGNRKSLCTNWRNFLC